MSEDVRVLTAAGNAAFNSFLLELRSVPTTAVPWHLLTDEGMSDPAPFLAEVEREPEGKPFANRYDFGKYLVSALANANRNEISLERGLWNWLALFYFDQLCPADSDGLRHPLGDLSVYYLDEKYRHTRYYRHLVRSPWLAVSLHPVSSRALLIPVSQKGSPLIARGEIFEQVASRQSVFRSKIVVDAVYALYFDPDTGRPRAGSGGSSAGSPRRLGQMLKQFGLTYDLEWGEDEMIMKLLPKEFASWKKRAAGVSAARPKVASN
jgi:hypothetical protein